MLRCHSYQHTQLFFRLYHIILYTAIIKIANNPNGNGFQFLIQSIEKTDVFHGFETDKDEDKSIVDDDDDTPIEKTGIFHGLFWKHIKS